jgi:hypothetical protein
MNQLDPTESKLPEIVESYRAFEPPRIVRTLVEDLLRAVPSKYLGGLKTIVLTNQAGLSREQRRKRTSGRKQGRLAEALGVYNPATRSSPAIVTLHVDNILDCMPSWGLKAPLLRYLWLSQTLYHEIGHHIHAVHKPVYEGKENVAEDWSRKLSGRFLRTHYWYLLPVLLPISYVVRLFKWIRRRLRSSVK